MSWTWQGRQLTTAEKGGTTLSYTYDSGGVRTSKTVDGVKTEYLLNGTQILAQKTGSSTLCFFYDQQGNRPPASKKAENTSKIQFVKRAEKSATFLTRKRKQSIDCFLFMLLIILRAEPWTAYSEP